MAISKAQQKAVAKYDAKAYDKTLLRLPKGRLDVVRDHAASLGESVNGFIGRAILEAMERDGGGAAAPGAALVVERVLAEASVGRPQEAAESTQGAGAVSLPFDTLEAAQRAADAAGEAVPDFIRRAVDTQAQRDKSSLKLGINPVTGGKLEKEA